MSFSNPTGTRGARQPRGRLARWVNQRQAARIRAKGRAGGGGNTLVLNTVGRRSGQTRSTPVAWFDAGDDAWLIVASAAGAVRNPDWYYNLAAHPDEVSIDVASRHVEVAARELHGDERAEAWRQVVARAPGFGRYQQKTDRELPVIRLARRI